jgi:hypothetical protein
MGSDPSSMAVRPAPAGAVQKDRVSNPLSLDQPVSIA